MCTLLNTIFVEHAKLHIFIEKLCSLNVQNYVNYLSNNVS